MSHRETSFVLFLSIVALALMLRSSGDPSAFASENFASETFASELTTADDVPSQPLSVRVELPDVTLELLPPTVEEADCVRRLPDISQERMGVPLTSPAAQPAPGSTQAANERRYLHAEPPLSLMADQSQAGVVERLPPTFPSPPVSGSEPYVEVLSPVSRTPPTHAEFEIGLPPAYVPPVSEPAEPSPTLWAPWWYDRVSTASLLSEPPTCVRLDQLMELALSNSPVVAVARLQATVAEQQHVCVAKHLAAKHRDGRISDLLLEVARRYWDLYRARGNVVLHEQLQQSGLDVLEQLNSQHGSGTGRSLIVLAEAVISQRQSRLSEARTALRLAQNRLASIVSVPSWEENCELIPLDPPVHRRHAVRESDEIQRALAGRAEIHAAVQRLQAANLRTESKEKQLRARRAVLFKRAHPQQEQAARVPERLALLQIANCSQELAAVTDQVKLEVKNAIVELNGSLERLQNQAQATQHAVEEIASFHRRRWLFPETDRASSLYLRELLDAQDHLARAELEYLNAQASYSLAILKLHRANGTIFAGDHFVNTGIVGDPEAAPGDSAWRHMPPGEAGNESTKKNLANDASPTFEPRGTGLPFRGRYITPANQLPLYDDALLYSHEHPTLPSGELPVPRGEMIVP